MTASIWWTAVNFMSFRLRVSREISTNRIVLSTTCLTDAGAFPIKACASNSLSLLQVCACFVGFLQIKPKNEVRNKEYSSWRTWRRTACLPWRHRSCCCAASLSARSSTDTIIVWLIDTILLQIFSSIQCPRWQSTRFRHSICLWTFLVGLKSPAKSLIGC